MKCVTYHYIRNKSKVFPYYNSITKKNFKQQLKSFNKYGLINNYDELFLESDKYLLTFDDGFKDHIYAAELLKKKNAVGIFFIPTLPLINKEILDVHKTHLIAGKVKGQTILNELQNYLTKNRIYNFSNEIDKKKYKIIYENQVDSIYKKEFKKIMNYYGDIKLKHKILDYLLKKFEINIKSKDYYLNKKEIRYLSSLGMVIGSLFGSIMSLFISKKYISFKIIKDGELILKDLLKLSIPFIPAYLSNYFSAFCDRFIILFLIGDIYLIGLY